MKPQATVRIADLPADAEILRYPDVQQMTKLSRTTLWRLQKQGLFPEPFPISGGLKGWLRSEIEDWIAERARR